MSIVLCVKEILDLNPGLERYISLVDNESLDFTTKYRLMRIKKKIKSEIRDFEISRQRLLKKYGERIFIKIKGDTKQKWKATDNYNIINKDSLEIFNKKVEKLLNQKVEIDSKFRINISDLAQLPLSIDDILSLYPLLNDNFENWLKENKNKIFAGKYIFNNN